MTKFKGLRPILVRSAFLFSLSFFSPAGVSDAFVAVSPGAPQPLEAPSYKPDAAEYFSFAVKMRGLGNLDEAARSLAEVRSFFPGTDWEKRANLLLGLIALDQGRAAEAAALIEEAAGMEAIDDYILFFQAGALHKSGRFVEAAGTYDFIISSYPSSALKERAAFRKASALMDAGGFREASGAFRQFISSWPKSSLIPEANFRLAGSLMAEGLEEEALAPLKEVSTGYPLSQFARESDALLSKMDFGVVSGAFTPAERFRRSENYFVQASYEKALAGYATLLKEGAFRERALMRSAIANIRLKRYKEGEKALREYLSLKDPSKKAEALYWLAFASMRQGREDGVFEAEKALSENFRKSDERAKALLLIARLKAGKDPEGAALAYKAVLEDFGPSPAAEEAFWNMGWEAYSSGRFIDAYDNFSMYLESRPRGALSGQFLYWKARAVEKLGRPEEAGVLFGLVCPSAPQSFYCLMAEVRGASRGSAAGEAARPLEVKTISAAAASPVAAPALESPLKKLPRYRTAEELMLLGLGEQASNEIDLIARSRQADKAALVELAKLLYEASDFYRGFRIYRAHLSAADREEHLPLGYPMRLVESVREKAPPEAADPFLVAAVMREESHFNPGAVSPVGALGLMQIMPSTGKQIARELGEGFRKGSLLDPSTSIRFGSWYLGQILKRFSGDAILAIAGYNAGPNAAARWAGTLPPETDEFVESIPYEETRGYVKRVLRSYAEFLKLGGEQFHGRVQRPAKPSIDQPDMQNEANASPGEAAF